ncbi:putative polysaccharide biosynthesis protein [Rhodovulum bhavnagarense]|uniref:Putative polysaccharide biosynthesis protein n=1 Tax=Rhodovulum bhavnagarense TaxID=992286 RepID=A0A4R2R970_9RHOB|nr:sugar-transfer associated ATP-grasp domain-containing protein [Rhodovulum bhavnagarense]TCP58774.1 putative polysaccharide biosynthesis protein [Rhodovulum bhavnagarense]
MKRLLYLAYYLRRMNWDLLRRFMRHVEARNGISPSRQVVAMVVNSLRYNVSPLEVYQFGFFGADKVEKSRWAGTGTMYEFQRRANPPGERSILDDKRKFHDAYRRFFRHEVVTLPEMEADRTLAARMLERHAELVFKPARGNCGIGLVFAASAKLKAENLPDWMRARGFDLVEESIRQHPDLQALSPSAVNTVRIFTCLDSSGRCRILGCRLRISVNSSVDNMAAGNLAAPVDEVTGRVCGPGVYSDITKTPEPVHPVTGVPIEGFQIPYWPEALALVREAAALHPQNRSIGWDIVITPDGPGLIEGNHDWCKLVWQLPIGQGLKHMLEECA